MARKAVEQGVKAAEGRTVKHGVSRLLPYVPPWLLLFVVLGIAVGGWALWGGSHIYPVCVWTAHLGASWISRQMTKHKPVNDVLVLLAQGTIVASGLLSVMIGVLGPTSELLSLWAGVGFTVCAYWCIRRMHLTGDAKHVADASSTQVQKLIDSLNGARLSPPQQLETGAIEARFEVDRGNQSVDELKQTVTDIEQITHMRPGAGRMMVDPKDAGAGKLVFYPTDLLEGVIPWRGPSAFGESIALPLPLGKRADMSSIDIYLTADESVPRNAAQWLVMGMNGAGKSKAMVMLMADALTRKDVTVWAHDHVKGLQTLKPLIEGGGLDWVSMNLADGKTMMATTRLVIQARARWMGAHDHENWVPGCGLNLLLVWFEEASDLGHLKDIVKLVREGRSVGVIIFISMQRASHTTIDTDARAQLSGNICFGVESSMDASFGLPDWVRDNGAQPERWGNTRQGYVYVVAPGIDETVSAVEGRTFLADRAAVTEAVKRGNMVRRPLGEEVDQLTIRAAGNAYANRMVSEAYLPGHPLYARAIGLDIKESKDVVVGSSAADRADVGANVSDIRADHGSKEASKSMCIDQGSENDTGDVDTSAALESLADDSEFPACPVPDLGGGIAGMAHKKLSTEQCRELIQTYLADSYSAGAHSIGVPDVLRMKPPIPRGREWLRQELMRLASGEADSRGYRLHTDDDAGPGAYQILAPGLTG